MTMAPLQKMQFDALNELIVKHNELVLKLNAATGDKDALYEQFSSAEKYADLRDQIDALQKQIDEAVAVEVEAALNSDSEDTEAITTEVKDLKSTVSSGLSYYKKLYGDESGEAFPKVERLKGARGVGGGNTGGRRVRGFRVVITDSEGVTEYENFASAAKALGNVSTAELQEFFFAKAGAEKLSDVPDVVEFSLTWDATDEEGESTEETAQIKAFRIAPTGAKEEAPEASSVEEDAPVEETSDGFESFA